MFRREHSLGNFSDLISSINGSFSSRNCSSQHELSFASGLGFSCIGSNELLKIHNSKEIKAKDNIPGSVTCKGDLYPPCRAE